MLQTHSLTRLEYERALDITLAGSFPASDPPPWTLGVSADDDFFSTTHRAAIPAAIDVVVEDGPRFGGSGLASLAEAIVLAATVPFAILIAGLPVAALAWAVTRALGWLGSGG
jgi:hypothetical protein